MRDILMSNEYGGWDFVTEYHQPPLSLGDDDDTKLRKTKKIVEAKRSERAKKFSKAVSNKKYSDGQVKYLIQSALKEAGVNINTNSSNSSKSTTDKGSKVYGGGGYPGFNRYAAYECNNCGQKGHIYSHCPARTGANSNSASGGGNGG